MLDFGILWMNARNLSYIRKLNDKKGIRLADNKEKTKRFLQARWIPVPTTYDIIKNHDQLRSYDFNKLPVKDFIIKPMRWSRWRGIYRVKNLGLIQNSDPSLFSPSSVLNPFEKIFTKQSPYIDNKYKVSWSVIDDTTFRRYLLDILYAKSSLTWDKDQILIEELLVAWWWFERYCEHWLADVRVIVYNHIPVAAMLRVPTEESDGKANLDRWALWMWVEVWSGKIYWMYQLGKIHRDHFPAPFESFAHQTIPYWNEILSYSSKIQYFTKLWYLALDRVVTEDGPKILEINARAWLKFQLATQLPIKRRLEKVWDLNIITPEKWVEISQTLFSHHKTQVVNSGKVLYLTQHWSISAFFEEEKISVNAIIEVDLTKNRNYLSPDIWDAVQEYKGTTLKVWDSIKFDDLERKKSAKPTKNRIVLWREAVEEYYVKPIHKIFTRLDFINPKNIQKNEIDEIHILDQRIDKLSKILNTSRILKPVNFLEELDTFITRNWNYNPHFEYRRPSDKKLQQVHDELSSLQEKYFGTSSLQSNFALLFKDKIEELFKKITLIRSYKKQKTKKIVLANQSLFGNLDEQLVLQAQDKFFKATTQDRELLWPKLTRQQVYNLIKGYVDEKQIPNVKIKFDSNCLWRMSIKRWKNLTIRVSEDWWFREQELLATLAHEIDVHVRRHQAWFATWWRLLQSWTAWYISDEEWLAILASQEYLPDNFERIWMYQKYYLLSIAGEKTFSELVWIIRTMTNKTMIWAFKWVLRLKKWMSDTANRWWWLYMKDKIYLEWYTHVSEWLAQWWKREDLMIWKIKIDDLPYIQ